MKNESLKIFQEWRVEEKYEWHFKTNLTIYEEFPYLKKSSKLCTKGWEMKFWELEHFSLDLAKLEPKPLNRIGSYNF